MTGPIPPDPAIAASPGLTRVLRIASRNARESGLVTPRSCEVTTASKYCSSPSRARARRTTGSSELSVSVTRASRNRDDSRLRTSLAPGFACRSM